VPEERPDPEGPALRVPAHEETLFPLHPDTVSSITGTPKDKLIEVYKLFGSTGNPNRVGTECYAMGWTQHTVGTQNIRAMAIIQLLLGNVGMRAVGSMPCAASQMCRDRPTMASSSIR